MGGIVGGGGGKPDTSALNAQIAENARLKAQQEQQQRTLAEEEAAKRKSLRGGGSRGLLSGARLNPESGVTTDLTGTGGTTLGG